MLAKSVDYGLPMIDSSLLRVANTPDTEFLVQAELRAIQSGLEYKEIKYLSGEMYKGYVKDGEKEGVGITTSPWGYKEVGEYHLGRLHGCSYIELASGDTYWG